SQPSPSQSKKPPPAPMVSGYHFLPVAPASWRKTIPAAAVTSVNCRAAGGGTGGAMAVACWAGLGDSGGFWESLHAPTSRTMPTTLPTSPRRTMPPRCRTILPPCDTSDASRPHAALLHRRLREHTPEVQVGLPKQQRPLPWV